MLRKTYTTYLVMVREALCSLDGVKSRAALHSKIYRRLRAEHNIASQLIIEATSHAWSIRNTAGKGVKRCVVRFDARLFSFKQTKRGNPVLTLRANNKRIGLPLSRDGAYQRLLAHLSQGWKLTSIIMKKSMMFLVAASKTMPEPPVRRNWLGVDVNSPRIAISAIGPGCGVLKQTYFGKEVATKQFLYEEKGSAPAVQEHLVEEQGWAQAQTPRQEAEELCADEHLAGRQPDRAAGRSAPC